MHHHTIYLAGPIAGCSYNECTNWRQYALKSLAEAGIKGLSPMRAKDYLAAFPELSPTCGPYAELGPMSTIKGITSRDRFDCTRCDVLLVNLLGATRISIGTMMEVAWADLSRIPIVCAIEKEGNLHEHGMLQEMIQFRVETLDAALDVCKAILM